MNGSAVEHIPVLANTLAEQISLPPDAVMVDATIGQGGHSLLFGQSLNTKGILIGLDIDKTSLSKADDKLKNLVCKVILLNLNFTKIGRALQNQGIEKVDFILADLGVSSAQLTDYDKGLSFLTDMPLDMRIDKRIKTTAADIVNKAQENDLADLIYNTGRTGHQGELQGFSYSIEEPSR